MSVKLLSADALRADLETIALTWPDGIPPQQQDRVNAIKSELKRRGEPIERPPGAPAPTPAGPLDVMTTEELEAELRALSTRSDDASQTRFANVRYELRRRASAKTDEAPQQPQIPPRALEFPSDDEVARVAPRRPAVPAPKPQAQARLLEKKPPAAVCGYTATGRQDGSVVLEYEILSDTGSVLTARVLEGEQADDFIAMVTAARTRARKMATGE
jgi:hypothetical protein